jgi:hypothetical protein
MSVRILKTTETINLRKIDPKFINQKYFKGEYSNRELPENKVKKNSVSLNIGKDLGNNAQSEIYRFKDKNNNGITIYTTNHSLYKYVMSMQEKKETNFEAPILKCCYCKRGKMKHPIGMPICMERMTNDKKSDNLIFHVINQFCDCGCVYSYLKRKLAESRPFRDSFLMNAEQILHCFYYTIFPDRVGQNIRAKPDWELLRENGGPLTDEEFDSNTCEYTPLPSNIFVSPSKKQYLKLNLKTNI